MNPRNIPILLPLLLATGCLGAAIGGEKVHYDHYLIRADVQKTADAPARNVILALGRFTQLDRYDDRIFVRTGEYEFAYRERVRLSESPSSIVRQETGRAVRNSGVASFVVDRTDLDGSGLVLSGEILRFDQVAYAQEVEIAVYYQLLRVERGGHRAVWAETLGATEPCRSDDEYPEAMSRALTRILEDLVARIGSLSLSGS